MGKWTKEKELKRKAKIKGLLKANLKGAIKDFWRAPTLLVCDGCRLPRRRFLVGYKVCKACAMKLWERSRHADKIKKA